MIRHRFKRLRMRLIAVAILVAVLLPATLIVGYEPVQDELSIDKVSYFLSEIEINLHEMASALRRYLIQPEKDAQERVADSQRDLQHAWSSLFQATRDSSEMEPLNSLLRSFKTRSTMIDPLTASLIDIADDKRHLLGKVDSLLMQVDQLYSEQQIPTSMLNDSAKSRLVYKQEIKLAKVMRELGRYLKTGDPNALENLKTNLNKFNGLIQDLRRLTLDQKEGHWLTQVQSNTDEKHLLVSRITLLYQQKNIQLVEFNRQLAALDQDLDENIQPLLKEIKKEELTELLLTIIFLIALIVVLIVALIMVITLLFTTSREIDTGLNKLLEMTQLVAIGDTLDYNMLPSGKDEFRLISIALLQMQQDMLKANLSHQQQKTLLDHIGKLRFILTADGEVCHCSDGLYRWMANETDEVHALLLKQFDFAICKQLIELNILRDMEWHLEDVEGHQQRITLSGIYLDDDDLLMIANPVKTKPETGDGDLFQQVSDSLLLLDAAGRILKANAVFNTVMHLGQTPLAGIELKTLCQQQYCSRQLDAEYLAELADNAKPVEMIINPNYQDAKRYVRAQAYRLPTNTPGAAFALVLRDISRIRLSEERIHRLAFFDALTGLPNRESFIEYLDRAMLTARRHESRFALLFMDLDNFKDVNDTLGHQHGDRLLQVIAERIRKLLRESDFAARLGGDEFCIICEDLYDAEEAGQLSARLITELNRPYDLNSHSIIPQGSIGISIYPQDATTASQLIQAADTAMYEAKDKGKNGFAYYSDDMTERAIQRIVLEQALHQAVKLQQFELYYQPLIDLRTGRMRAVEALIRWHHPLKGLVLPEDFIPAAERMGLMEAIGCWVMETAAWQLIAWRKDGIDKMRMAVNISSSHFEKASFIEDVKAVFTKTAIEPKLFEIEITESMVRDIDRHVETCNQLRQLGLSISIDDFGTGYSSLSVLKNMSIHTLKIDKTFIDDLLHDQKAGLMLGGIVAMAKGLQFDTVVEGIETQQQLELLLGLDCDLGQGFYFSQAVPASQIAELASREFLTPDAHSPTEQE